MSKVDKSGMDLLETNRSLDTHDFVYKGYVFRVHKGVMSPSLFDSWEFFINCLRKELRNNESLIEIGSGCGIIGIILLIEKQLSYVVLSDIAQASTKNSAENIERLGISEKAEAINSDVFDSIRKKADTAFWNYPWVPVPDNYRINDDLDLSFCDPNNTGLRKYVADFSKYIHNPHRGVYLGFGSNGNQRVLMSLCKNHRVNLEVVGEKEVQDSEEKYILYKLSIQ